MKILQILLLMGAPLGLQRLMVLKLTLQTTSNEIDHIQFESPKTQEKLQISGEKVMCVPGGVKPKLILVQ